MYLTFKRFDEYTLEHDPITQAPELHLHDDVGEFGTLISKADIVYYYDLDTQQQKASARDLAERHRDAACQ